MLDNGYFMCNIFKLLRYLYITIQARVYCIGALSSTKLHFQPKDCENIGADPNDTEACLRYYRWLIAFENYLFFKVPEATPEAGWMPPVV